eukprot:CAMPEP_0194404736 /NCGR_PEP_ID=MMETSP0176-20130528/3258_1 /TAXON_ID=216777 /ORGANISM="Proboscia alata, Strain PI-D3" /LENGTH=55 /DNA_ID=CAMNT_0039203223 /DNA_START=275 /DNA_END=441 /DNA_ORIENTATION=-
MIQDFRSGVGMILGVIVVIGGEDVAAVSVDDVVDVDDAAGDADFGMEEDDSGGLE